MTLPEIDEHEEENHQQQENPVGQAALQAVAEAAEAGRVAVGIHQCAELLASFQNEKLLCLMAADAGNKAGAAHDASVAICHVLIRAFCHEHAVPLLAIDTQAKLATALAPALHQWQAPASGKYGGKMMNQWHVSAVKDGKTLFGGKFINQSEAPAGKTLDQWDTVGAKHGGKAVHGRGPVMKAPMQEGGTGPQCSCIIIKYPKHAPSEDEEKLLEFIKHEQLTCTLPYVALPD